KRGRDKVSAPCLATMMSVMSVPRWRSCFHPQSRNQRTDRLAAMRQLVLPVERQLGAGHAGRSIEEMRIVAEAARAARSVDDRSVPRSLGDNRLRILRMADELEHTRIVRAPVGDACERFDQLRIVGNVGPGLACIACA